MKSSEPFVKMVSLSNERTHVRSSVIADLPRVWIVNRRSEIINMDDLGKPQLLITTLRIDYFSMWINATTGSSCPSQCLALNTVFTMSCAWMHFFTFGAMIEYASHWKPFAVIWDGWDPVYTPVPNYTPVQLFSHNKNVYGFHLVGSWRGPMWQS